MGKCVFILPCPFCDTEARIDCTVIDDIDEDTGDIAMEWRVACIRLACDARGPAAVSSADAIELWNKRTEGTKP